MVFHPVLENKAVRDWLGDIMPVWTLLDEKGFIKDPAAYHRAIAVARNPEAFAKHFYDQGKSEAIDGLARESKNIDMGARVMPENLSRGGMKITALDSSHGNRLVIKSNKK